MFKTIAHCFYLLRDFLTLLYAILNGISIYKMHKINGNFLLTFAISNGIIFLKGSGKTKVDMLSSKIKALRKQKKQTQQNIADLLGVRRSTYGEYERGKIMPPMDKLKILADHFNVTVDHLIGNDETTNETEIDVSDNLESALEYLKNDDDLFFQGKPLDNETRDLLISSIENGLKMAYIISKSRGK